MLNCFYLYAYIWIFAIFLYDLGWSSYLQPLCWQLRLFLYLSIIISMILGYFFRYKFKFEFADEKKKNNSLVMLIIVGLQIMEYIYCKQVPLISVIRFGTNYTDFAGIPTLHVLIYTFSTFYSQYLFHQYLTFKNKNVLLEYAVIVIVVFGLQFMRGGLLICLGMSGLMWLSSIQGKIQLKHILATIVGVVVVLYLFGGLGNLRQGYEWNDSSAFFRLCNINDKYPTWLPTQFSWGYMYITISLANLNHNIANQMYFNDINGYSLALVPDFIVKRFMNEEVEQHAILLNKALTTATGYSVPYEYGGLIGIYLMFLFMVIFFLVLINDKNIKTKYRMSVLSNIAIIMVLFFFTNGISKSAISFPMFFPIVASFMRFKVVLSKKNYGGIRKKNMI